MKILNIFYGENKGGIERNMEEIHNIFSEKQFSHLFLKFSKKKIKLNIKNDYLLSLNEKYYNFFLIKMLKVIFRAYRIKNISKKYKITHCLSYGDSPNLSNILSKILFFNKSKIIINFNNSLNEYKKTFLGRIYLKIFILIFNKFVNKGISISEELKQDLINLGFDAYKLYTIYNPINFNRIIKFSKEKVKEKYKKIFNKNNIIYIHHGRLEKVKNQKILIESFIKYKKQYNDRKSILVIIGDGKEKIALNKIISKNNANNFIFLLGHKDNPYKYLAKANYYAFSSLSEGFGRSLVEAGILGLPVLTWDFKYGAKEYITNKLNKIDKIIKTDIGIITPYNNINLFTIGLKEIQKIKKINLNKLKKYDIDNYIISLSKIL